jgi:putative nucleotidyltransferase with HDIG domain
MIFDEKQIDALRERVRCSMSERRFTHTAEVEKMAVRICALYLPEKTDILRAAALLHDITKEKSTDEQLEILALHGAEITALDRLSPKTLHARTAELVIVDDYSEFASPELLLAVRRHTTGSADMTLLD